MSNLGIVRATSGCIGTIHYAHFGPSNRKKAAKQLVQKRIRTYAYNPDLTLQEEGSMKRDANSTRTLRCGVITALLLAVLAAQYVAAQPPRPRRVAVFGSSVANGTGDELRKEGYTGRLRELLAPRGWEVLNQSRGGDNTRTMAPRFAPDTAPQPNTRYLLPVNPGYVVLALSLGNEGIVNAKTTDDKDVIYNQFHTGIRGFIDRSRQHNIVPIVTLCYTRNDF